MTISGHRVWNNGLEVDVRVGVFVGVRDEVVVLDGSVGVLIVFVFVGEAG